MADNQIDDISVLVNKLKERFRFLRFNFRRAGGLKILAGLAVLVLVFL